MTSELMNLLLLAVVQLVGGGLGSALAAWLSGERAWKGPVIWTSGALLENIVAFVTQARMETPLLLSLIILLIGSGLTAMMLKTTVWRTTVIVAGGLLGFVALGVATLSLIGIAPPTVPATQ